MAQPEHVEQDENPAAGLIGWEGIPGRSGNLEDR
jgi:hypothetical protein